jgi:hypothetical protein
MKTIFGILDNTAEAEGTLNSLQLAGFSSRGVSVLFADRHDAERLVREKDTKASQGAAAGAGTVGVLGGILGWLAGIGSLAIPGVGPFVAAGPILTTLGGTVLGATAGGLLGALGAIGISQVQAQIYENKLQEGGVLVAVHTEDDEEVKKAYDVFKRAGAKEVASITEKDQTPISSKRISEQEKTTHL